MSSAVNPARFEAVLFAVNALWILRKLTPPALRHDLVVAMSMSLCAKWEHCLSLKGRGEKAPLFLFSFWGWAVNNVFIRTHIALVFQRLKRSHFVVHCDEEYYWNLLYCVQHTPL